MANQKALQAYKRGLKARNNAKKKKVVTTQRPEQKKKQPAKKKEEPKKPVVQQKKSVTQQKNTTSQKKTAPQKHERSGVVNKPRTTTSTKTQVQTAYERYTGRQSQTVKSHYGQVVSKTRTAGKTGAENRKRSLTQTKSVINKGLGTDNKPKERTRISPTKTTVRPITGAGNAHRGAKSNTAVAKGNERREGKQRANRAQEVVGDVVRYAGKDLVATGAQFLKNAGNNKQVEPDYKASAKSLENAAKHKESKTKMPKGVTRNARTGTVEKKTDTWNKIAPFADKAVESAEKEIKDATKNISDKKKYSVPELGIINKLTGMESTKKAKKKAKSEIEKQLSDAGLGVKDAIQGVQELAKYGEEQGWSDDTMLSNGKTWGQMKKEAGKDIIKGVYGERVKAYKGFDDIGKVSARDLTELGIKGGVGMAEILLPYIGTAGKSLKAIDAISTGSKALTTASGGTRALSEAGKAAVKNTVKKGMKGGNPLDETVFGLEEVSKAVAKSDLKTNAKREILANALQDATIGTGIDYMSTQKQGLKGKEAWKYMGESAAMNAILGAPIAGIAGRTGKAGKAALNSEIQSIADQTVKGLVEERRLSRRLGAKGLSPEEVQKALSKREVQEYIDLAVKGEKNGLTVEQQKHLARLSTKIEAQKVAYDNAITASIKATRESLGKASAIDIARLQRAIKHYDTTGNKAMAKEARQLLAKAEKNFDKTLDTVTKAAANVSKTLQRDFKVEPANEFIKSAADSGMKIGDASNYGGFVRFDPSGNIVEYHINKDSEHGLEFVFGHEFMHGFESLGKEYDDFVDDLRAFVGDEWDEAVALAEHNYKDVANADYEKEAVANLVGKHFFAEDSAYLKKLAGENPSLFARIYATIKKLLIGASEHDIQFEALSKRMDELFESLSERDKSIAQSEIDYYDRLADYESGVAADFSPYSTEALFAGGKTLQELIDDGINAKVAQELRADLKSAKEALLYSIKQHKGNYAEIAKDRKQIFKDYGWFEGYDGKWRYEIDDSHMHYNLGKGLHTSSSPNGSKYLVVWDSKNGKIVPASIEKVNQAETRLNTLLSKSKITKKEQTEITRLRRELFLHKALTDPEGVPLKNVLSHSDENTRLGFFDLYPDAAKDLRFKLSADGEFHDRSADGEFFAGEYDGNRTLTLNAHLFTKESEVSKWLIEKDINPDDKIRSTTVHELQHYIQDYEGFTEGSSPKRYMADLKGYEQDAAASNSYPYNFERDADVLEKITNEKEDIGFDIESLIDRHGGDGESEIDDFMKKYYPIMQGMSNDDLQALGERGFVNEAYRKLTTGRDPITVVNAEHKQLIKDYLAKDYEASQHAERNPDTIYNQMAGEIEAREVGDRVNMSQSQRRKNIPIKEGENIRYAEYPHGKYGNTGHIDKELPKRKTKNKTNLTRLSKGNVQSESAYYENLASGIEAAEKELQDAMSAYTDNAKPKGLMTDEVRAQVKAQILGGKELSDAQVETLAEAQVALHNVKVIIPESANKGTVKQIRANHGIAEDNVMLPIVKSPTAKNAQSVEDAYATLSKEYPDLFPDSIKGEGEQFQRLMDVSGLKGGAASRRGNYYVPKNRTMTPYKPKTKVEKAAEQVAKADKANAEGVKASKKLQEAKPAEEPKPVKEQKAEQPAPKETQKETPAIEKKGMIERDRRENTKKRENETAKRAFKLLNDEYKKEDGWVNAVTGKRENGAFGILKVQGLKEAEDTAKKELADGGYEKLKQKYFVSEFSDDPNLTMSRATELLAEIDRKIKAGDDNAAELFDEACDIMEKYTGITSLGGHVLNAAKKFMTSTPQGRKRVVYKEIERLEKRYKDRIKGGKLIPPEDKIEELINASGARVDELLDEINKDLWNQIPASLMERLNEYRHCFMLFNIKTHGRNVLGNSVFRLARAFSDYLERRILNSSYGKSRIGKLQGGKDASDVIINRQKVTHKELKDNYMYLFNEFHAIYDKSGSRNKFIETGRPDGVPTVKFKIMQKLIDFNYSALEKEDLKGALIPAFNKSYLSYCKARCPEKTDLRKFMENMTSAQKEKARQYALEQGEYATFRDSCAFSDWLTAKKTTFAGKQGKGGKYSWGTFGYRALDAVLEGALPFVKTPVNIFRRSVDYSPASLIMSLGKLAKADSPEMFQLGVHQFCTGLTGTGMAGFGVLLAQQGLITVKAGEESGDAYYDRDMGFQDYSIKINLGGKQYSWTLDWMSPMNMSLFAGAAFEKMFEKDAFDNTAALNAFFAITSPMTDMSFMSSPKDTMGRFLENASRETDGKETDFAGALAQLIVGDIPKNYVSGFFPQLMAQFAGVTDDYRRDTKSTRENVYLKGWESSYRQLVNKIPWARKYLLNPKVNRMGEDVKNDETIATRIINSFFNPANVKEITMNDEDRELINIRNNITDKDSKLYKYFYYNFTGNPPYNLANGKRMTYDESYKYAKSSRVMMNDGIKKMLDAESYTDMSWDMKANEVDGYYWIGKASADKEVYGFNYAMKVLKNDKNGKRDYNTWQTYKENAGGAANKKTFWDYYINKETLYNRSHPTGENTYRIKGLAAVQSGDQALIDSINLKGNKEPELKHYWEIAQKKFGKNAKAQANKEISDGVCFMSTNLDKAGVESDDLGMLSASAATSVKSGKKIDERVWRALGHFWNSAQAGGGLIGKYGYDLKSLEKLGNQLDKKIDNRGDMTQKQAVCDFIENDLGVTDVDEAACLFQALYAKGSSNPANKNSWKNPYKDHIDDHLKWGDNRDGEWGGLTKSSGGGGRGWGGWGHGGGGGRGKAFTPVVSKAGGAAKQKVTKPSHVSRSIDSGKLYTSPRSYTTQADKVRISRGKITNPFSTTNTSVPSNLNDAYRKRVRRLREESRKKR